MKKKVILGLKIAAAVIVAALIFAPLALGLSTTQTIWAMVPPLAAIVLALITKEVYLSLFVGIVAGALFYSSYDPVGTVDAVINEGFIGSLISPWNAGIFLFLVILGILVALINRSGAAAAFGKWAEKHIKSKTGALFATFILGVLIFIDDYFNCLTVGSVMLPVTNRHKISRAKLSFIIDATAAPVCMIAPISSWAAAVASVSADVGSYSGIELFVRAIPYNFYSLLTLVFVAAIIFMKFDYGPMKLHEMNAYLNGRDEDAIDSSDSEIPKNAKGKVIDLILPVVVLIILCVVGMVYVGGFFSGNDFITAFELTDASVGLPWGALIALIITIAFLTLRRVISFREAMECIPKGFNTMVPAILILTLALSLKNLTSLLGADLYVEQIMKDSAGGIQVILPGLIFLLSLFLAFSTGTSWGTTAIMLPIIAPVLANSGELYIIGISACLAGAVCGDHCSPISDTTIMASAGAQCNHVVHVSTQLPYALTIAAISLVCFIIAGFVQNVYICLAIGVALTILTLFVLKMLFGEKKQKA